MLAQLVERGVRHVVLSPGSRSQALALVAAELEARDQIVLHVRIDERVAGFTALGIGRETGMPAAVVCTSGTAAANLLPAVLEADHAGVPLLLLTADRPPELRGVGANQATRQVGMYGPHARWQLDLPVPADVDPDGDGASSAAVRAVADEAMDAALGRSGRPGPVHLNLPYRQPLSGALPAWCAAWSTGGGVSSRFARSTTGEGSPGGAAAPRLHELCAEEADSRSLRNLDEGSAGKGGGGRVAAGETGETTETGGVGETGGVLELERGARTVVVAGADAGPAAEQLAHDGGWPLIAEIVSGARFGRHVVHGYRALLREADLGGSIQRVLALGHPTLSREVTALLSRRDVEVIAVAGRGEPLNLNGATVHTPAVHVAPGDADRDWLGRWMRASQASRVDVAPPAPDAAALASANPHERLQALSAEVEAARLPLTRELLVDAVWRATWPHDRLVFGSSRLVRVADGILPGKKVPVHANRGLAGIDGTIATAVGIAAASQLGGGPGVTRVLLGDLAFLHDVGALLLPDSEPAPRIQIVVGNDGGGTIFDSLEVASTAGEAAMRRVMYTPQAVAIEQLAAAYGWDYARVTTRTALDQELTATGGGRRIIEVPLER
ncbi:2-succinyl-5-enolpyruvyl-6-hydroxy-3-cyclohexene-1-carboxylate synthase [Microbacterium sp.]|uniref:2-succinyl-5-enolpyruvyl-6-hydroxy-3- cyclohexene-1-carboxylate synthase n=1 Tax=Microbacterium sp. TaxID=51671 RepID=UPI003A8F3BFB